MRPCGYDVVGGVGVATENIPPQPCFDTDCLPGLVAGTLGNNVGKFPEVVPSCNPEVGSHNIQYSVT